MLKLKDKKVYILIFFICLLIMTFSLINDTNLFYILKNFLFNPEYRNDPLLIQDNFFPDMSIFQLISQVFKNYYWEFDVSIIFGTNLFQLVLPLVCSFVGIKYYTNLKTVIKMRLYRQNNYTKNIFKDVCNRAFYSSLSFFSAYLVLYFVSLLLSQGRLNGSVTRDLFVSVLGSNFSEIQPYTYYIIEGIIRFFIVPFIYTFFSCSLCYISNSQKNVLFMTNIYYYGLSAISFGLFYLTKYAIYINPSSIMVIGSFDGLNSGIFIFFACIPLVIGTGIIYWRGKNVEI